MDPLRSSSTLAYLCYNVDNERISPKLKFIFAEEDVKIECKTETPALWYFYDGSGLIPIGKNNGLPNNVLYLTNLRTESNGYYECEGTTAKGLKFAAKMKLVILGKFDATYIIIILSS